MRSPASTKEVQQFTGRIAALSRFLSCTGEKACHFFVTLKQGERFTWTQECEEVFQKLKNFLSSPPILTRPQMGKPLILYLAVSEKAMSSALVQDSGDSINTSKVIKSPSKRITPSNRGSIKSQVLDDFVVELSGPPDKIDSQPWTLSVDGSSNLRGSGAGVVLEGPDGVLIEQSLRFAFKASNNQAEYEALIVRMKLAKEMDVEELKSKNDSQLVTRPSVWRIPGKGPSVNQISGKGEPDEDALMGDQKTLMIVEVEDWRFPIMQYLENDELPVDVEDAAKIRRLAANYTNIGGQLYKRGFSYPLLLCVGKEESKDILKEVHEGSCGSHIGARSL
ncbi:gag-pol polyprotein, partial [Trifolium medium]|nr:gag-pol polyprotein [Trifolium medium]